MTIIYLEEHILGVHVVAAHHRHLGGARLLEGQPLDVLDVVHLVRLLE